MNIDKRFNELMTFAAAEATAALTKLLRRSMTLEGMDISIVDKSLKKEIARIKPQSTEAILMTTPLIGVIEGVSTLILSAPSALKLNDILLNKKGTTITNLNAMEKSALLEVGNIVIGCFLNSLGYVSILNDIVHKKLTFTPISGKEKLDLSLIIPAKDKYRIRIFFHIKHNDIDVECLFYFDKRIIGFLDYSSQASTMDKQPTLYK